MSVAVNAAYAGKTVAVDRSNYWRYYGLRRDPFVPGTRENEFYLSARWEQSFDLIHYLCQEANVLLTVTGTKGCGKTTFLRHFVDHFGDSLRVCQLAASSNLDVAGLVTALTRDFTLPAPVGETLEEQLETQLGQLQYSAELCLITIDSAHRLADETLQALLYLIAQQSENQMRLHILLVGEESLKKRLSALTEQSGEKELCHHLILEPFDIAETKNYLTQRMSAAGLPAALPLSAASITRIHNQAEGVPARINAVARQVLVDSVSQRRLNSMFSFLSARKSLFVGSIVLLILLSLCAIFLGRGAHYPLSFITAAKASDVINSSSVSLPAAAATARVDDIVPLMPRPVKTVTIADVIQKPEMLAPNQDIVIGDSSVTVENIQPQAATSNTVTAVTNSNVKQPSQPIAKPIIVKHSPVLADNDQNSLAISQAVAQQMRIPNNNEQLSSSDQSRDREGAVQDKKVAEEKVSNTEGNYTIQLLSGSSKAAMSTFIKKHNLQAEQAQIVRGQYKGVDWYRLNYGHYQSEAAAKQAVKELPEALQNLHPWVKKNSA